MDLNDAQVQQLEKVFKSFDLDGSGAISVAELESVTRALGIVLHKAEVEQIIVEADHNKNGEVEYNEFLKVMEHHLPKVGKEGRLGTFGHLISRKARTGPSLLWVSSKAGDRVQISEDQKLVTRDAPDGWGIQLLDSWLSASSSSYNTADVILEVEKVTDGHIMVGVAGRNFFPSPWDAPLSGNKHCVVADLKDGVVWKKENKTDLILGPVAEGGRIHVTLDMLRQSMTLDLLEADNSLLRSVTLDELPPEATMAVCLGPGHQQVRILGSSTEVAAHEFSGKTNKDLWDDDNVQRLDLEKRESSATLEAVAASLE